MTAKLSENQVVEACQLLFGADVSVSRSFLDYVQPSGAKSAYRQKAKETHPDLYAGADTLQQQKHAALFIEILKAYDVLNVFFKERDDGLWKDVREASAAPRRRTAAGPTRKGETYASAQKREAASRKQPPPEAPRDDRNSRFWGGAVPFRPLEIGRFLYYSKRIPYQALIDALVWQRKQRPVIGDIAVRWGWLTDGAVEKIAQSSGISGRFGEKAVRLGLLTHFQVKTLLFYQRSQQERLGRYFVKHNMLVLDELERLVADLQRHNARVVARFMSTGDPEVNAHC